MLACGSSWQPTKVKRVIETLRTSTRVAKVSTDCGIGFLKGMGNPAGLDSLACELVGSELARWFYLVTPAFAMLRADGLDIPIEGGGSVQTGPAFISQEIRGSTGDGGDAFISQLQNQDDIAKLIVFDTWIRNGDRFLQMSKSKTQYQTEIISSFGHQAENLNSWSSIILIALFKHRSRMDLVMLMFWTMGAFTDTFLV
jgi:hypothetical protein